MDHRTPVLLDQTPGDPQPSATKSWEDLALRAQPRPAESALCPGSPLTYSCVLAVTRLGPIDSNRRLAYTSPNSLLVCVCGQCCLPGVASGLGCWTVTEGRAQDNHMVYMHMSRWGYSGSTIRFVYMVARGA